VFTPHNRIYDLINPWERKRNFGTCFIQTGVTYTHPPLPILFLNQYRVGQPRRVEKFLDESGLEELPQLHFDCPAPLFVEAPQLLLHDMGVR
jgi:hypothetical protein